MNILAMILLQMWIDPFPTPAYEQFSKDIDAVKTAKADMVARETLECAATKIVALQPPADDLGNPLKASEAFRDSMDQCGRKDALVQIKQMLRTTSPEDSEEAIDRKAKVAFTFQSIGMVMFVAEVFQLAGHGSTRPETSVAIPDSLEELP